MIQMTVMKVTEVKNKLGVIVGSSVIFKILGQPPEEVSSLGGMSLFLQPGGETYVIGQTILIEIHPEL